MANVRKIGIDANLFIYVLEKHPEFHHKALALFTAVESGLVSGQASELVYLEVLSKTNMTARHIATATSFMLDTRIEFAPISLRVLLEAAELRRSMGLKTPDAIHAASAIGCDCFVTNDAGLIKKTKIKGVQIVSLKDFKL